MSATLDEAPTTKRTTRTIQTNRNAGRIRIVDILGKMRAELGYDRDLPSFEAVRRRCYDGRIPSAVIAGQHVRTIAEGDWPIVLKVFELD